MIQGIGDTRYGTRTDGARFARPSVFMCNVEHKLTVPIYSSYAPEPEVAKPGIQDQSLREPCSRFVAVNFTGRLLIPTRCDDDR